MSTPGSGDVPRVCPAPDRDRSDTVEHRLCSHRRSGRLRAAEPIELLLVDLRALLRAATAEEVSRAREALALIAMRGYHRGRELSSQLDALLA